MREERENSHMARDVPSREGRRAALPGALKSERSPGGAAANILFMNVTFPRLLYVFSSCER